MRGLGWAAALLLAVGATAANAYDRLYVFGDSLVDTGNAQHYAPSRVPPNGRFTNGLNFADDLSLALGFGPATAYLNNGINYAVGGATALPVAATPGFPASDLGAQVNTFYAASVNPLSGQPQRPAIDANSLVLVTIGGNDVRGGAALIDAANAAAITTYADQVATAVGNALQTLYMDGARNFLLVGVPDVGTIPEQLAAGGHSASATAISTALNTAYANLPGHYGSSFGGTDSQFRLFSLADLGSQLLANPGAYKITNTTTGCVAGNALPDCTGYEYFDDIHPTAAVHQLIADAILNDVPEPASWTLMVLGFGFTGAGLRRARRTAAPVAA